MVSKACSKCKEMQPELFYDTVEREECAICFLQSYRAFALKQEMESRKRTCKSCKAVLDIGHFDVTSDARVFAKCKSCWAIKKLVNKESRQRGLQKRVEEKDSPVNVLANAALAAAVGRKTDRKGEKLAKRIASRQSQRLLARKMRRESKAQSRRAPVKAIFHPPVSRKKKSSTASGGRKKIITITTQIEIDGVNVRVLS